MSGMFCFLVKNSFENKKKFEVVKVGFSWTAFFFSYIWGFSHQIWIFSLLWFVFSTISVTLYFLSFINVLDLFFLLSLISLYWGLFGNNLLINELIQKQYLPKKFLAASNALEALLICISEKK